MNTETFIFFAVLMVVILTCAFVGVRRNRQRGVLGSIDGDRYHGRMGEPFREWAQRYRARSRELTLAGITPTLRENPEGTLKPGCYCRSMRGRPSRFVADGYVLYLDHFGRPCLDTYGGVQGDEHQHSPYCYPTDEDLRMAYGEIVGYTEYVFYDSDVCDNVNRDKGEKKYAVLHVNLLKVKAAWRAAVGSFRRFMEFIGLSRKQIL